MQDRAQFAPDGWSILPADKAEEIGAKLYVIELRIDTEIGLRLLADTLCKHELVFAPELLLAA